MDNTLDEDLKKELLAENPDATEDQIAAYVNLGRRITVARMFQLGIVAGKVSPKWDDKIKDWRFYYCNSIQ